MYTHTPRPAKSSRGGSFGKRRFGQSSGQHASFGHSRSSSYGPSHSPSRGSSRGHNSGGKRFGKHSAPKLNIAAFINKAVVTEEKVEHFVPEHKFTDFALDPLVKSAVVTRGYTDPTPIQDKIIPHILRGLDVVGLANTGTGKTGAFLIPLINKIVLNRREQVIILAPTRELALQIDEELRSFGKTLRLFSVVCVGGAPIGPQLRKLRDHNHFIIGTPGRVMDLMKRKALRLDGVHSIVLDEADRMLDMGFIDDMRFVVSHMPKERHTLFFSATMSPNIEKLIKDFLKDPVSISVKTRDTAKNVEQDVVRVRGLNKDDMLCDLLTNPEFKKVLVFGRTKHGVEKLCHRLVARGIKAESIHGDKSHSQRQRALQKFKRHEVQTLVATDVAARGLDIPDVTHVINYELPTTYDDYVHRIGRTGRGTKKGKALTFVD